MKKILLSVSLLLSSSMVIAETSFSFSIGSPIIQERRYYPPAPFYGYPPSQPYYYGQRDYYYIERDVYPHAHPIVIYRQPPPIIYKYGDKLHKDNGRNSKHYNFDD